MLALLEARRFRNLEPLSWSPGAGRHLLLGGNGAGKTSLLEAVYTVATTRSFRTPRLAECVRHGEDGFHLTAEVETPVRTRLEVSWDAAGLARAVNGARGDLAEHLEPLPVVAWHAGEAEVLGMIERKEEHHTAIPYVQQATVVRSVMRQLLRRPLLLIRSAVIGTGLMSGSRPTKARRRSSRCSSSRAAA